MDADGIAKADAVARAQFTYKADPVSNDNWRSHADDALAGRAWEGDCDDLASTVLDILGREGMAQEDRYRLLVASDGGKRVDHMVACVRSQDGQFRIVGDTFLPDYPAGHMQHRGLYYNRLSETLPQPIWREGVPWA